MCFVGGYIELNGFTACNGSQINLYQHERIHGVHGLYLALKLVIDKVAKEVDM